MKAVVIRRFGTPDVMNVEEVPRPAVQNNDVLIRVRYTSVNPVDWKIRNGSLRLIHGSKFPMTLGFDVAGEVVETGKLATGFKAGDRVFAMLPFKRHTAYAEYAVAGEDEAALIPEGMGFREAAAVPLAGLTAYQALHYKAGMNAGDRVLVYGASGAVGSFGVQLAKAAGAAVTAVCGTGNVRLVEGLGADRVLDYMRDDFTLLPEKHDIVFDAVGKLSFFHVRRAMAPSGRYVTTLPNVANALSFALIPFLSVFGYKKRASFISVKPVGADLRKLAELIRENRLAPLIDREYALEEIREAHVYSETGHAKGKIVVKV